MIVIGQIGMISILVDEDMIYLSEWNSRVGWVDICECSSVIIQMIEDKTNKIFKSTNNVIITINS